jgi:hypothetical protein
METRLREKIVTGYSFPPVPPPASLFAFPPEPVRSEAVSRGGSKAFDEPTDGVEVSAVYWQCRRR